MKSIIILTMAIFATACVAAWTPSADEIKLSAKEDARDLALYKLLAPSADEIKLSAKEDARDLALYKLLAK